MILDSDTLIAYFDRTAPGHGSTAGTLEFAATFEQLVVSPFVVAELEGRVRERFGMEGWLLVLEELGGGAWTIASLDAQHLDAVREGVAAGRTLAEASVAVLAEGAS